MFARTDKNAQKVRDMCLLLYRTADWNEEANSYIDFIATRWISLHAVYMRIILMMPVARALAVSDHEWHRLTPLESEEQDDRGDWHR